jgi:hypothetical protein
MKPHIPSDDFLHKKLAADLNQVLVGAWNSINFAMGFAGLTVNLCIWLPPPPPLSLAGPYLFIRWAGWRVAVARNKRKYRT